METKTMSKKQFWIRAFLFITLGGIVPIIYIAYEYGIFKNISASSKISGWGIIAGLFALIFVAVIFKYITKGTDHPYIKQIINLFFKCILPLVALIFILYEVKNMAEYNLDGLNKLINVISIMTSCELVAGFINPFPTWVWEKSQQKTQDTIGFALDKWEERKQNKTKK